MVSESHTPRNRTLFNLALLSLQATFEPIFVPQVAFELTFALQAQHSAGMYRYFSYNPEKEVVLHSM